MCRPCNLKVRPRPCVTLGVLETLSTPLRVTKRTAEREQAALLRGKYRVIITILRMDTAVPSREAAQLRAVQWLASRFEKLCGQQLGAKWFQHFEIWLWSARTDGEGAGLLLPPQQSCYDVTLGRKLMKARESPQRVASICEQLGREIYSANVRFSASTGSRNTVKFEEFEPSATASSEDSSRTKIRMTCCGVSVEVTKEHLTKLKDLYWKYCINAGTEHRPTERCFQKSTYCLLARYHALQGGHHKSGGFQAAIHERCFQVMEEEWGCEAECFASPLNSTLDTYFSRFEDTDAPFGSRGSFFQFRPTKGCFEANPPFDDGFIDRMMDHMESLLRLADDETQSSLMFIVIIPAWKDRECWQRLDASPWCSHTLTLPAREHGYYQGSQHLKKKTFKQSNSDSSIFFLQSMQCAKLSPVTTRQTSKLKQAFRPSWGVREEEITTAISKPDASRKRKRRRLHLISVADVELLRESKARRDSPEEGACYSPYYYTE